MIKVKNFVFIVVSLIAVIAVYLNFDRINSKIQEVFLNSREVTIKPGNKYSKKENFKYVQQVSNYTPYSYEDLINIFYSALNQGWDEFTFYCSYEYTTCLDDIAKISKNDAILSNVNNYVHPYNSYSSIRTLYDDSGEITVTITHTYSPEEITKIDKDIDNLIATQTNSSMSDLEKIRALHDYIINTTKYDSLRGNNLESDYDSARIQGILYDHYAICSAYADLMAVILEKLDITNYKISSDTHVWNAVYLDNNWYHLDLTWDDPLTTTGKDILQHSYFLIDNNELNKQDSELKVTDHKFDKNIFPEFNY